MSGRHAGPDPLTVALGIAWTAGSAALLALLALVAREPCPCSPAASSPVPASVPDIQPEALADG